MTRSIFLHFCCFSLAAFAPAAEPAPSDLLRQGLYAEEVTRDPAAAANQYEQIIAAEDQRRAIVATAIFRLAEVRRQQGKKDEAIALYQRLLIEFPRATAEGKLAREHLTELGGKIPEPGAAGVDEVTKELERLKNLLATSPDVFRNEDLSYVENPRVLRFMLDSGVSARKHPDSDMSPLEAVAQLGNLECLKLLLEKVKDQVADDLAPAFAAALEKEHLEVARTLLAAGADPNWQSAEALGLGYSKVANRVPKVPATMGEERGRVGPPLAQAIRDARHADGTDEAITLLLEAKADVNLAAPRTGLTPLHFAVVDLRAGSIELVKRLLALGAKRDAVSTRFWWCEVPTEGINPVTPLTLAIKVGNWEAAKLMLTKGPKANPAELWASTDNTGRSDSTASRAWFKPRAEVLKFLIGENFDANLLIDEHATALEFAVGSGSVELTQLLLAHGADPNLTRHPHTAAPMDVEADPFAQPTAEMKRNPVSKPLLAQVPRDKPEALLEISRLLIDAGSKPDAYFEDVLAAIAQHDAPGELVRKLLAQRPATVNLKALPKAMDEWQPVPRGLFLDEVVVPSLAKEPGIHLLDSISGKWQTLTAVAADHPLPATASLLLGQLKELFPKSRKMFPDGPGSASSRDTIYWPTFTLLRSGADGKIAGAKLDLTGEQPFPDLESGDILELGSASEAVREDQQRAAMETKLAWHLRKRISFPITLECDGKTSDLQLRGGLLVFDPTKHEAPLMAAGPLVGLFVIDGGRNSPDNRLEFVVKRAGWSELKLPLDSKEAAGFQLQPGDRLVLPPAKDRLEHREPDQGRADLVIPGFSFARSFSSKFNPPGGGFVQFDDSLLPTLVQAIASVYAGWPEMAVDKLPPNDGDLFTSLAAGPVPVIPSHPDFSKIRIRRLGDDGKETFVAVDLTAAIAACTDATPSAAAADVMLRAGDLVELPLQQDRLDQPWTGFSPAEARFFHQALSGNVLVTRGTGKIEQVALNYEPPAWRATGHGLLPLPPAQGTSNLQIDHVVPGANSLRRGETIASVSDGSSNFFLHDGDQVSAQTNPVRLPRPRIVPPGQPPQPQPVRPSRR